MRTLRRLLAVVVLAAATSAAWLGGTAGAESCLTVAETGLCSTYDYTVVPGTTVGGPTPVTTPPIGITFPVQVCIFIDCFEQGETIPLVPAQSETLPLPGPFPVPTVTVPDGWEIRVFGDDVIGIPGAQFVVESGFGCVNNPVPELSDWGDRYLLRICNQGFWIEKP